MGDDMVLRSEFKSGGIAELNYRLRAVNPPGSGNGDGLLVEDGFAMSACPSRRDGTGTAVGKRRPYGVKDGASTTSTATRTGQAQGEMAAVKPPGDPAAFRGGRT